MYLTVESICQHGTLDIPVENAPNATIVNGKAYTWYEAGNIVAGVPLYLVGKMASNVLPLPESLKALLLRTAVSLTSAFVGAFVAILFFSLLQRLGLAVKPSISMTLALIFSTFLLWYFKMYLRESILTLCMLGAFYFLLPALHEAKRQRSLIVAGSFVGFGILTKLVFALNAFPFLLYLLWNKEHATHRTFKDKLNDVILFSIPIVLIGCAGTGFYNYLRMGNPFDTGYTGGTSFPTPLYVGLYGLLLSPGKGLIWFAPILMFLLWAFKPYWQQHKPEAACILGLFILNILLYSKYISWGGDGSWGPRYLAPLVPLLLIPVVVYLQRTSASIKKIAVGLIVAGCLVQAGGVSIYAGAYIREIGEFPYQKQFDDQEFLYRTHFIPNFSPVIGHWRMLTRNIGEHVQGSYPKFQFDSQQSGKRIPLVLDDQGKLLHTLDFWFMYALYSGVSSTIIIALFIGLMMICGMSGFMLRQRVLFQSA
jgi:hypothetical protein